MFSDPFSSSTWYFHCVVYACALTRRLTTIYSDCDFEVNLSPTCVWLAVCCKITQCIFLCNNLYWFNFNTGYFHSKTIFIQLQHRLFLCKTNIYSTSTPKVMIYETNIYIQLQRKKNIFTQQNIFIQLFKFPDIDKFLFNKAPPPYPPAAPSLKTWKQHI